MKKLRPLSKISNKSGKTIKPVREFPKYMDILLEARSFWDSLDDFRKDRERYKRYTYGDQWSDKIKVDGEIMTEAQYLMKRDNLPLKTNLIRRLVRTMVGVYRSQSKEPTCTANDRDEQRLGETMSVALQVNWKLNKMKELGARSFEEFLISGVAFYRESYGWRNEKMDCWTDAINPNRIFFDSAMRDVRHWDLSMIGEIHDLTIGELLNNFASSSAEEQRIADIYKPLSNREYFSKQVDRKRSGETESFDFFIPYDNSLFRVIEVWTKEQKKRYRCHDYLTGEYYKIETNELKYITDENNNRLSEGVEQGMDKDDIPLIDTEWFVDSFWKNYYLTPSGECLREEETPYSHKSHPYALKIYPFIDGEIHSFVSDVIDQQRYVNRLITLNDFVIRNSNKGVLLVPSSAIPDGKKLEDIREEWNKPDGVIEFNAGRGGEAPRQASTHNATNVGIKELLQLHISSMEEITGVNGALQGKTGFSGQSASLYQQQQQNANTALLDLLEAFSSFTNETALKKLKNIQQHYDSKRMLNIVGKNAVVEYDPDQVQDIEFDLSIEESTETPTYRLIANDWLMQLWQKNAISIEQLLEHGSFPFADELLQSIKADKEAMANGDAPNGISPELMAQIGANQENVNNAQNIIKE